MIGSILFLIIFIIMSLVRKKLSNRWLKFVTCYISGFIFIYILIAIKVFGETPGAQDTSALIIAYAFFTSIFCLFILYLFYGIYYLFLNKNNNDVDKKGPLKKLLFVIFILIFIIIAIIIVMRFKEDEKYFNARNIKPDIIKVDDVNNIPILDDYTYFRDIELDEEKGMIGKKVLLKLYSDSYKSDFINNVVKWNAYYEYNETEYNYEIYYVDDRKIEDNSFAYVYGIIEDVVLISEPYERDCYVASVVPEKVYYISENDYSLSLDDSYNGSWCFDNTCIDLKINDSKLADIDFRNKEDNNNLDLYKYNQFPSGIIEVTGKINYNNFYGNVSLNDFYIEFKVDDNNYIFVKDSLECIGTFVGENITYLYKLNDINSANYFYITVNKNNDVIKTIEYGNIDRKDNLVKVLLKNKSNDYVLDNDNIKHNLEVFVDKNIN